jgi:hypothetical protein
MTKLFSILAIFCLTMSLSISAQEAKQIATNASDAISMDAMEMTSTLNIYDKKGNVRIRTVSNASKTFGDVSKTIIKFISPADVKGTGMLIYDYKSKDDDMWVYLPSLKKTRRIVSSQKAASFMGSEFSNSDMSKPNIENFNYKNIGTETINGNACYKIEAECKTSDISKIEKFSKKISYIEKQNFLTYKTDFYNKEGVLFKTIQISDYKKQSDGKYQAFKMTASNHKTSRKSVIIIDSFNSNSLLKESDFTTSQLEK